MTRILFLCTGNSCRSQMAEGWARHLGGEEDYIASAGIEAHGLNRRAVEVMAEAGIDITGQTSDCLDSFSLEDFDLIVTVCGDADERCPVLPPGLRKLHWPLADPAKLEGSGEAIMQGFRASRDDIHQRVAALFHSES